MRIYCMTTSLLDYCRMLVAVFVDCMRNASESFLGIIKSILFQEPQADPYQPTCSPGDKDSRDCALVKDASGSMLESDWEPSRLEAAKSAAGTYANRLYLEEPDARIGIVAYGDKAKTISRLTAARRFDDVGRRIDQINCLGSTNMRAGLLAAMRLLEGQRATCQVVLLTDGHNTERCPLKVAKELKEFAVIECVGIGGNPEDVDEQLLKDIASAYPDGSKRYRWIGDREKLVKHFHSLAGRITRT